MKKTRYIYTHDMYEDNTHFGRNDMWNFFETTGIKLHVDTKKNYYYSYEFAGNHPSWYTFSHTEEVEVSQEPIKLKSKEPITDNWKSRNRGGNGKNVKLNPKSVQATKLYHNYYKPIKEDGFSRPNKAKKSPPKGEILE